MMSHPEPGVAGRPADAPADSAPDYPALVALLERRLEIIADHGWRDRDSPGQLRALQEVSMEIEVWGRSHGDRVDFHMQHYLQNCSFDKALAVARKRAGGGG